MYELLDYDFFEFPQIYEKITGEELCEFLRRVFTPERCAVSVVLPLD